MARLTFLFVYALLSSEPLTANSTKTVLDRTLSVQAVTKVYDGDTFTVDLANCNEPILCRDIPIRMAGIDAPEIHAKCTAEAAMADLARTYLKRRLNSSDPVELRNVVRDKYFRLRAEVWIDGHEVGKQMLQEGLVRDYYGGARMKWCVDKQ